MNGGRQHAPVLGLINVKMSPVPKLTYRFNAISIGLFFCLGGGGCLTNLFYNLCGNAKGKNNQVTLEKAAGGGTRPIRL